MSLFLFNLNKFYFKKGEEMNMEKKLKWIFIIVLLAIWQMLYSPIAQAKPIEFRFAGEMEIASLDPIKSSNNWEWMVAVNIYDTLVFPNPDPKERFKPWIAEFWSISSDRKTYTFRLKKGLKFHDGSEITSEDVAFSMERILAMGGPVTAQFKMVKPGGVQIIDKYTVALNLSAPDPSFIARLTIFRILNKKLVLKNKQPGKYGEFGDYGEKFLVTNDAGSGPYKVISMKHGDRVILEKFNDYSLSKWRENSFDKISIYMIPEHVTIATKFEKGEIDMATWALPVQTIQRWRKNPNFEIKEDISQVTWYIVMNNKKPPFDDIAIRKAVSYAFDYDTEMNAILGGGKRSTGPVPPGIIGHSDNIYYYKRDLEKAREWLKKSKYTPAQLSQFNIEIAAVAGSERFKKIALLAVNNLAEIGLKASVKAARWTDICAAQQKPETAYSMVVCYQSASIPHPDYWLVYFTPKGWGTAYPPGGIYYENPKVTELINEASQTDDPDKQQKFYEQAQKLIVEDAPILFTHYDKRLTPFWRYVKGYFYPAGAQYYELWFHRFWMDINDELYKKNH